MSTLTLPARTEEQRTATAQMLAALVREGVAFTANATDITGNATHIVHVVFTGGF
jgi:hypothetical protein